MLTSSKRRLVQVRRRVHYWSSCTLLLIISIYFSYYFSLYYFWSQWHVYCATVYFQWFFLFLYIEVSCFPPYCTVSCKHSMWLFHLWMNIQKIVHVLTRNNKTVKIYLFLQGRRSSLVCKSQILLCLFKQLCVNRCQATRIRRKLDIYVKYGSYFENHNFLKEELLLDEKGVWREKEKKKKKSWEVRPSWLCVKYSRVTLTAVFCWLM